MITYEGQRYNVVLSTLVTYDKASEFEEWFQDNIGTDLQKDEDINGNIEYVMCDITNEELRLIEQYEDKYLLEVK
jgi:quinol monooxygenase YgiN